MRPSHIIAAAMALSYALPAEAAFTVDIDPTLARGSRTILIFDTASGGPCGTGGYCAGSGTFYYETIVDVNVAANQVAGANPNELRFTFQDRSRSQTFISLLFSGPNGTGTLLSSQLSGMQEIQGGCLSNPCTTDNTSFTAISFGVRLTDTTTGVTRFLAPVPEPSTWLMMLVGFGMVGSVMRRRHRVAVSYN